MAKSKPPIPILIDNQEKKPWAFPSDQFVVSTANLFTGDYTIAGFEERVTIERKSGNDFVSSVIHDWLRFKKQLIRMAGFDDAIIAVECTIDDIKNCRYDDDERDEGKHRSQANPESIIGKAHAITIDFGVPVLFWHNRTYAQAEAAHYLRLVADKRGYR